jgi:hypothetical protein
LEKYVQAKSITTDSTSIHVNTAGNHCAARKTVAIRGESKARTMSHSFGSRLLRLTLLDEPGRGKTPEVFQAQATGAVLALARQGRILVLSQLVMPRASVAEHTLKRDR